MRRYNYSFTPLLLFSFEERMDACLIFSHCPLNQPYGNRHSVHEDGQFLYGMQVEQLQVVHAKFVLLPEDVALPVPLYGEMRLASAGVPSARRG